MKIQSILVALIFSLHNVSWGMSLEKFMTPPKLVVVIVIDQFRADYLTRFNKQFMAAGTRGEVGGFQYLMKEGAYFPTAEYDVLQSMTCPGHAMIMTGSHPAMNGIPMNEWYDRGSKKVIRCTEDTEFGDSPQRLKTTTVGDELKNSGSDSRVFTVALKDRSAIMLGGHRADLAIWLSSKYEWTTSPFYAKEIPNWLKKENEKLTKNHRFPVEDSAAARKSLGKIGAVQDTFEVALAALEYEKLGQHKGADILAISLSSHDIAGHAFGPNSQEMHDMTLAEDLEISHFLTRVKKHMGSFKDVVIVLTGDHGIPATVNFSQAAKIEATRFEDLEFYKKIYEKLDQKFGKPKKEWVIASKSFNYYLNEEALKERGVSSEAVQTEIKNSLIDFKGVLQILTATDAEKGSLSAGLIHDQYLRQYNSGINGDFIIVPRPYYMQKDDNTVNHQTGYAYDRTVPLIILGPNVKKGVYPNPVKVLDLAPTLSFMLGILAPATNEGRILHEIL